VQRHMPDPGVVARPTGWLLAGRRTSTQTTTRLIAGMFAPRVLAANRTCPRTVSNACPVAANLVTESRSPMALAAEEPAIQLSHSALASADETSRLGR